MPADAAGDSLPIRLPPNPLYRVQPRCDLPPSDHLAKGGSLRLALALVNEIGLARRSDFARFETDEGRTWLQCSAVIAAGSDEVLLDAERAPLGSDGKSEVRVALQGAQQAKGFFLKIAAVDAEDQERNDIVPLVLGPFVGPGDPSSDAAPGIVDVFRPVDLPPGATGPFLDGSRHMLLLQEEWGGGIPAKAWDSAFAIAEHLRRRPDLLSGQERLLDLSSGNALLGLLVSRLAPGKEVFVTDLPEALDLPRLNAERNGGGVEVRGLDWYAPADSGIGPRSVGFAILSDLLYENEHFPALLGALDYLIRDGGRILVGYKRRGLTEVEESEFWESLGKGFAEVVDERELDPPGMEGSGVELRLFQR